MTKIPAITSTVQAANEVYKLPPKLFDARCKACWFVAAVLLLVIASFWSLNLKWAQFLSLDAFARMGKFLGELLHPEMNPAFLRKLLTASLETLAMSGLVTRMTRPAGARRPAWCSTRCAACPSWCGRRCC
jgi:phosphonate transport system permease protein